MEIVSNFLRCYRCFETSVDKARCFEPTHVFEHHYTRKNYRTWIHFVLTGIFWCGTVCCFEDRIACNVVDVATWSDTNTTNDSCERIGDIITIKVKSCYYRIFIGTKKDLLKESISDRI